MPSIYEKYKPLRNYLRRFNRLSVVKTCYDFIQHVDFDRPLPANLQNPRLLTKIDRFRNGIVQWEFEILIREAFLNCPEAGGEPFQTWNQVAKAINHIKRIENDAYGLHSRKEDDVLYEMVRIAHRQFPWQVGLSQDFVARYHRLYRQDGLRETIAALFGLDPTELFQVSLALSGHFLKDPFLAQPIVNQVNRASAEKLERFVNHISLSEQDVVAAYRSAEQFNVNWAYTFNVFREHPLVKLSNGNLMCPIPDFLVRRVTSGLYFDLVRNKDVSAKFLGPAVQELVGIVARHATGGEMRVSGEASYGPKKNRKDSIDWIISDATGHLFIEAKAARVRFSGMSDLMDTEQIRQEFVRIRKFAVQSYQTIHDAMNGEYSHWQPDDKPVFLGIVTLEDWQSVGIHIEREVIGPLHDELEELGIDPLLPAKIPMAFFSVADLEAVVRVCREVGIRELFEQKSEGEYPQWQMSVFIANTFGALLEDFSPTSFAPEWDLLGAV